MDAVAGSDRAARHPKAAFIRDATIERIATVSTIQQLGHDQVGQIAREFFIDAFMPFERRLQLLELCLARRGR